MNIIRKLALTIAFTALPCTSNALEIQELLAASKMAGACGVMQQMAAFQESTKMKGGDEFISRFWLTEITRLGFTQEEFFNKCEGSIEFYERAWKLSEKTAK